MPVVGLDLGAHTFRAIELDRIKDNTVLQKFGTYDNPKIHLESESDKDLEVYASALRDFFAEVGLSTDSVTTALPESDVFTRVISVPNMSAQELKGAIEFEAEQYIPLPLNEVSYDFQILEADSNEKDKMNVLLVAAKKSILKKYIAILKQAGLTPTGMEPETLAVTRAVGDSPARPSASIIVNFRSEDTQIIISYKGFVRFTRGVGIGGDTLTRAISQDLNLDFNQADEYKKTYGLDSSHFEGKVFNSISSIFDNVISEITRSKIFFNTRNPDVNIRRVIISGGTALMPGLLFYLATKLDLEVELAQPWRNIVFSPKIESQRETLNDIGPMFVTAVGLALKEFRKN